MQYKNLRELRFLNGRLTQKEISEKLGISVPNYSLMEKGRRNGSKKTWLKIQEVFNLSDEDVWKMQKNIKEHNDDRQN